MSAGVRQPVSAPYGVDRVDQPTLPLSGTFAANHDGEGVTVYIIDSGIRVSHAESGGRASVGADFVGDGRKGADCNGHGTHVAGIVGGKTYGVAEKVKIVAVRALNCNASGTISGVLAAINWVADNHAPNSVANMSLGGSSNAALDAAVTAAVAKGVPFTLAAGNGNLLGGTNACTVSPARLSVAALYLDANPGTSPAALEAALLKLSQKSAVATSSKTPVENSHIVFTGGPTGP